MMLHEISFLINAIVDERSENKTTIFMKIKPVIIFHLSTFQSRKICINPEPYDRFGHSSLTVTNRVK